MTNLKNVTVIIPTRDKINPLVLHALPKNIKIYIAKDTEQIKGILRIREYYANKAKTKYLFFIDDDIIIPKNAIQIFLKELQEKNLTAVSGDKKAIAYNNFSKGVLKFKEYPSFIKTGFTLWVKKDFLEIMNKVPENCPSLIDDIIIFDILEQNNYKYFKMNNIICEHYVKLTKKEFFNYRYKAGTDLAYFYLKWRKKGYWVLLAKMFFGMPLSKNQAVLIYRSSSFFGMIKGLFKKW